MKGGKATHDVRMRTLQGEGEEELVNGALVAHCDLHR